jgi:amino acid adenylation domain-containing protein
MSLRGLIDQLERQGVQLWYEGNRLRFRSPQGALSAEQRSLLAAERDAVVALLRERDADRVEQQPLSYGQRSLWLVQQDAPSSAAYHVAFAVEVSSQVDTTALRASLQALVDRHAILRTTYEVVDGRPLQRIAGAGEAVLDVHDASLLDDSQRRALIEADYKRPFDLAAGPVWRTSLFTRTPTDHVLLINAHHIALDGWSLLLLLDELRRLYPEQTGGPAATLARPETSYADYTRWQTEMLQGPQGHKLAEYWQAKLAAPRAEVEVLGDHPRPARKSVRGATFAFQVDAELTRQLQHLARDEGTTLFALLLSAFEVLLVRYTGVEDIVVGTPTLGRNQGEFATTLGHFVNPVPLRTRVSLQQSFRDLQRHVRQTLLEALDGQEYPLALMVEKLHPVRDPSRSPLFETMFVLQRFEQFRDLRELLVSGTEDGLFDFAGLRVRPFDLHQQEGQFDLGLELIDHGDSLGGALKFNADIYDAATAAQLGVHFVNLLRAIVVDPSSAVGRLPLLAPDERRGLLAATSSTPDLDALPLHSRFEAQVARRSQAIALSFEGASLNYEQLNRRANQVAHRLCELGVGRGTLVGLCAERSFDLVIGLLGILKAGGAYLPIDLSYPADRITFMMTDAQAPVLVTQRDRLAKLPVQTVHTLCLDDPALAEQPDTNPAAPCTADDLIYVIYTSGSTGQPKGTLLTHRAVDRLLNQTQPWYHFDSSDVWTLFHSVAFDFSVWELWGALAHGGRLVVVPYWVSRSPESFLKLLRDEAVTVLNQTPSAFRQLMQADLKQPPESQQLRHVIFGGEALELQSLRPWLQRYGEMQPRLVNMYGITETCVHVTYRPIGLVDLDGGRGSVIGQPIPDLRLHVLDAELEPVPIGVVGELYVGGPGLAVGYLNRPELTEQRFVPDPFVGGERLYRTGDLARRLRDGDVEYIGRADQQVKVRGFRIELGEIEAALSRHSQVRQAAVVVRDDGAGSRQIVAYLVADQRDACSPAQLREHLRAMLPEYMVPAAFVFLDTLPLTSNNKVDARALPEPAQEVTTSAVPDEPRTMIEFQLLALWRQVLGDDALGTHDNFFDRGGHSLLAVELVSRIEQVFGRKLPLATLFQAPAVAQMAELLQRSDWKASWRSLVAINPGGLRIPMFLVPGVGGNVLMFGKLSKLLGPDQPLYGLQARGLDGQEEPFQSVPEMAEHYVGEILAARPQGPYFIGGTCTGGVIAYEVAQRLKQRGADVQLALLETWPPATAKTRSQLSQLIWPIRYLTGKLFGYLREMSSMPVGSWPAFLQQKWRTGRAVFDVGLKETLIGSTYYVEKVVEATVRAVARYEPRRYPGSLLNVIAIKRPLPSQVVDTRRLWEQLADGPNEAVMIPAEDSGRLFVAPHVTELAELLRSRAAKKPCSVEHSAVSSADALG